MTLRPLLLAALDPDADRALLASLADYPDHVSRFCDDGGEGAHLLTIAKFAEEVALPGRDGEKAAALLGRAKEEGAELLAKLTRQAVHRELKNGRLPRGDLFNDAELAALQKQLGSTIATADLLGRSRIRLRLAQADKLSEDEPTDFACFDQGPGLGPMVPHAALEHFRRLVPSLNLDVRHFGPLMERRAFTMAEATSAAVLERVKTAIQNFLRTGEKRREVPKQIDRILDDAGVSPKKSGYAKAVFRTNCMSAYNAGAQAEFSDPDVAYDFPIFKYSGVRDGRQRCGPLPKYADHNRWFGKYFDRSVLFDDVRGRDARDVINCRCTMIPIFRAKWKRLQAEGAKLTPWPQ